MAYVIEIERNEIGKLEEIERATLVLCGRIFNELVWLNRLAVAYQQNAEQLGARGLASGQPYVVDRSVVEIHHLTRITAGKIREAVKFLHRCCFTQTWFCRLEAAFTDAEKQQLADLRAKIPVGAEALEKWLFKIVRDNYAFHYPDNPQTLIDLVGDLDKVPSRYRVYATNERGAALKRGSEEVLLGQMFEEMCPDADVNTIRAYLKEVTEMTGHVLDIIELIFVGLLRIHNVRVTKCDISIDEQPEDLRLAFGTTALGLCCQ